MTDDVTTMGQFEISVCTPGHLIFTIDGHEGHIVANRHHKTGKVSSIRVDIYQSGNDSEISNAKAELLV